MIAINADKRQITDFRVFCGSWAVERNEPWIFAGWIARNHHGPDLPGEGTFEEKIKRANRSDHGEAREVDMYPNGAVCWYKE